MELSSLFSSPFFLLKVSCDSFWADFCLASRLLISENDLYYLCHAGRGSSIALLGQHMRSDPSRWRLHHQSHRRYRGH